MLTVFRTGIFLAVLGVLLLGSAPSTAQTVRPSAITLDELKRLAALPVADQLRPQNQAKMQQWFFGQIAIYQDLIRTTYVGRSKLVRLGPTAIPAGARYTNAFAAPTGHGASTVTWTNTGTAHTNPDGTIELPNSNVTITAGEDSTCWHESLHTIFLKTPSTVPVEPYQRFILNYIPGQNDYAEAQDHVYLEGIAQSTFEWLRVLAGFELQILAAADAQEELRKNRVVINYEVEQAVWAKAAAAWRTGWHHTRGIAPVPKQYRDEFERLAEVRVPFIEDVIGFYMSGEIHIPDGGQWQHPGTAVKVPEWVMWPDPLQVPVILEDLNRKKMEVSGTDAIGGVDVRAIESRPRMLRPPLTRGTLEFSLRSDAQGAQVAVSIGGKPVAQTPAAVGQAWRRFVANLADPAVKTAIGRRELFHITVTLRDAAKLSASSDVKLPLHILYRDDPKSISNATPGLPVQSASSLYAPTEAVIVFRFQGSPANTARPVTGKAQNAAAAPTSSANGWVLVSSQEGPTGVFRASISESGGSIKSERLEQGRLQLRESTQFSWDIPPSFLKPEELLNLHFKASDNGSVSVQQGSSAVGMQYHGAMTTVPLDDKHSGKCSGATTGDFWNLPKTGQVSASCSMLIPSGKAGARLGLLAWARQSVAANPIDLEWIWLYEWNGKTPLRPADNSLSPPSPTAPTEQTSSTVADVSREGSPPPPLDKHLDDDPPVPGDIVPTPEPPLPPPVSPAGRKVRWFTQAAGVYRFRQLNGWSVLEKRPSDSLDTIGRDDKSMSIFAERRPLNQIRPGSNLAQISEFLNQQLAQLVKSRMAVLSDAKATETRLGGSPATIVSGSDPKDHTRLWFIYFIYSNTLFVTTVSAGPAFPASELPPDVAKMFITWEYLK